MPRSARIAPPGEVYHLLTRGNNRQDVFREEEDYRKYLEILSRYKERYAFPLYHYVLMTNHVHLVLETAEGKGTLAEIMKGINLSYAQYYKAKNGHLGHFWQDRYKSILVSKDQYLLACGSYVELNPVRAGLSQDPQDYPWSSYHLYAYGKRDPILDEHPIYQELSEDPKERRKAYRQFVQEMLLGRKGMRGEMEGRILYGNETFLKRAKAQLGIEERVRVLGKGGRVHFCRGVG